MSRTFSLLLPIRTYVLFSLSYYDAELKEQFLDYKIFEFSDYDFSGDDLDLDDMKKWTKKGYELLQ